MSNDKIIALLDIFGFESFEVSGREGVTPVSSSQCSAAGL
jgi:hypothetical protein